MIKYEFLIQNKQTGTMYDASELITEVAFKTLIRESASKFEFSLLKDSIIDYHEGDPVRFKVKPDGASDFIPVFFGYIFSKEIDRWGMIKTTCYDQLRYLKAHSSYVFTGATATSVIQKIANDFQLKTGLLADTEYVIAPSMIQHNKALFDIIYYGLQQTQLNTGKLYIFYDDFGSLTLTEAKDMYVDVILGSGSLATDYKYKTDIDKDTYNQIMLVQPDRKAGKEVPYVLPDPVNIAKWGVLQKFEEVNENMNEAQIRERANTCLAYYNRVLRTLKLEQCLGVVGLRAGHMAMIDIPDLGDISLSKRLLLDSVDHKFGQGIHTMDVAMRVII